MVAMSKRDRRAISPSKRVFSQDSLRRICTMDEEEFGDAYGFKRYDTAGPVGADFFYFQDNGSDILAVAHLDTVADVEDRACHFLNTSAGQVVYSRALDDRLGAYIILDMLPKLGHKFDILLTVGEEIGASTAAYFALADDSKQYNWIIEFDRGGTDVVGYQYEDVEWNNVVRASGARIGNGIFSDIGELEHLGCKAFNWGTGYQDYHSSRSHAYLTDTFDMVDKFLIFAEANVGTHLPHQDASAWKRTGDHSYSRTYGDPWDESPAILGTRGSSGLYGYPSRSAGGWDWTEGAYADTEYADADTDDLSAEERALASSLFGGEISEVPRIKGIHEMTDDELATILADEWD